ncbi:MAG: hypothetical protein ACYS0C_05070 [Planctomycetota bacterium]
MSERRMLKSIHLANTAWFIVCISYILVLALRQAGFHWWLIFSLSGHSALLIFLLISLYLFAIFRGVGRGKKIEVEHPLTSTNYYMVFYVVAPFLGGLAGTLGMISESRISRFLLGIALGTLLATFLVWIIVDPVTGLVEMLLPASRKHRLERLALVRALRQKQQEERKRLLAEIMAQEEREKCRWQEVLRPYAEKLAKLLAKRKLGDKQAESQVVDIGANAWRMGGLNCMRQLHAMAMDICQRKYQDRPIIDYISIWWDGIGSWRSRWLEGEMMSLGRIVSC